MNDHLVWLPLAQATTPGIEARPGGTAPPAPVSTGPAVAATAHTAATATSAPGTEVKKDPPGPLSGIMSFLPIILMFVVLYFILFRGQRKEEKRRKGLIAELKKGDRVMTIGGLVARVVSIEGDEVVLKVDESANVKATYRKSAIQEVLGVDDKK